MSLQKEAVTPPVNTELGALKRKIAILQGLYLVLFLTSLLILIYGWQSRLSGTGNMAWAVTLGGAVITRLYRTSQVNKYNAMIMGGGPAPMS